MSAIRQFAAEQGAVIWAGLKNFAFGGAIVAFCCAVVYGGAFGGGWLLRTGAGLLGWDLSISIGAAITVITFVVVFHSVSPIKAAIRRWKRIKREQKNA